MGNMFPLPDAKNITNARVHDSLKFTVQFFRQVTNDEGTVIDQREQQRFNNVLPNLKVVLFQKKKRCQWLGKRLPLK